MSSIPVSDEQKMLAVWVAPHVQNDGIFDPNHSENRDDENYGARLLRQNLAALGWRVHTQDVLQRANIVPDAVLFLDVPRQPVASLIGSWAGQSRLYSLIVEPPLLQPHVWDSNRHKQFEKLFTWQTELAKQKNYVSLRLASPIPQGVTLKRDLTVKRKLAVMVAGNKRPRVSGPGDLYAERLKCIRWYEASAAEDFDLYGVGWNDATVRYSWRLRRLGLIGLVNLFLGVEPRPSYRGTIKLKRPLLEQYRFNIAFENTSDQPGYITEKLFDAFLGSCVPVYLGAPDVTDFIPKDCFIDFRDYGNWPALDARLRSMSDAEYLGYIDRIEVFLRGPGGSFFGVDRFVDTLIQHVTATESRLTGEAFQ